MLNSPLGELVGGFCGMPKPYDDAMKKLVGGNPQDLVSLVI